jgi:hypothetical protein
VTTVAPSYDRPMTSAAAPRGARRIYLANLIAQIAIFFSGALVRLTGSGLGCPTSRFASSHRPGTSTSSSAIAP